MIKQLIRRPAGVGGAAMLAGIIALGSVRPAFVHAAGGHHAPAQHARVLHLRDFFDVYPNEVADVSGTEKATIAGIVYRSAIELERGIAHLSYNTHRYRGFKTLSFSVGLTDSSDAGSQDTLVVSADGHRVKTITAHPGSAAIKVVIPLRNTSVVRFSVKGDDPASSGLLIANPTLLGGQVSAGGRAALTLKDFFNVYPNEVDDVSGTDKAVVASIRYVRAIELDRGIAALSYNTHRHPGYTALSMLVGMTDSSDAGSQDTLAISADGRQIKTITAPAGHQAVKVVIPLAKVRVLRFSVQSDPPAYA